MVRNSSALIIMSNYVVTVFLLETLGIQAMEQNDEQTRTDSFSITLNLFKSDISAKYETNAGCFESLWVMGERAITTIGLRIILIIIVISYALDR